MELKSAVPSYPNYIDSRFLQMEVEFFQLSKQQVDALMILFFDWCRENVNKQCITQWWFNGKKCKPEKIACNIEGTRVYDFGVEGYVISNNVYDQKSMKRYDYNLQCALTHSSRFVDISNDYLSVYNKHFSDNLQSVDEWESALMSIFWEPKRICYSTVTSHDLYAFASMCPHYLNPEYYHGSVRFRILNFCLGSNLQNLANRMSRFLQLLSTEFVNVNARVSLSPLDSPAPCSGYMTYFGGQADVDLSSIPNEYQPSEWKNASYLRGAEWFNVISPLVQQHIPDVIMKINEYPMLNIFQLASDGICVQVKKDIQSLDVQDLLPPKCLLYSALYPGKMRIPKEAILSRKQTGSIAKPRKRWELVPLLRNEICITEKYIIFQHQSL